MKKTAARTHCADLFKNKEITALNNDSISAVLHTQQLRRSFAARLILIPLFFFSVQWCSTTKVRFITPGEIHHVPHSLSKQETQKRKSKTKKPPLSRIISTVKRTRKGRLGWLGTAKVAPPQPSFFSISPAQHADRSGKEQRREQCFLSTSINMSQPSPATGETPTCNTQIGACTRV